jgi:hypothetical protein
VQVIEKSVRVLGLELPRHSNYHEQSCTHVKETMIDDVILLLETCF